MGFVQKIFPLIGSFYLITFVCLWNRANGQSTNANIPSPSETIEPVVGSFDHGEGPHWDEGTQTLYFVDIYKQNIHRLNPATGQVATFYVGNGPVGFAIPVNNTSDKLVAGAARDFISINWNGENNKVRNTENLVQTLTVVDTNRNDTRWNDAKVDSSGRLFGGTMGPEVGSGTIPNLASFYRISSDLIPRTLISPVSLSNGLAWNPENNILYWIDTPTSQVAAFDYDSKTGDISNRRVVFDVKANNLQGNPDGMTIDTQGNIWVALFDGSSVINVDPRTGTLLRQIKFPVTKVTSVAFGGPQLDILYVTTSRHGLTETELQSQPNAGCVFAVRGLGVRGSVANKFNMNL